MLPYCVCGPGFAPNPAGRAYRAPQTRAGWEGQARCPFPRTSPSLSAFGLTFPPFRPQDAVWGFEVSGE